MTAHSAHVVRAAIDAIGHAARLPDLADAPLPATVTFDETLPVTLQAAEDEATLLFAGPIAPASDAVLRPALAAGLFGHETRGAVLAIEDETLVLLRRLSLQHLEPQHVVAALESFVTALEEARARFAEA